MKDGCCSIILRNVDVLTIHNGRCYARPRTQDQNHSLVTYVKKLLGIPTPYPTIFALILESNTRAPVITTIVCRKNVHPRVWYKNVPFMSSINDHRIPGKNSNSRGMM